jgi:CRP/FNR family transcriptional regulator, cyclic AMP receptor protein
VRTSRRKPYLDRLKSVEPFRTCTQSELREVNRLAEYVMVESGEVLVCEGETGREVFLILSGSIEVTQAGRWVNTLGSGDFFGELTALSRGARNATVTALSDTELLIIGPRQLGSMAQIPGFRTALLKAMADRLRASDARVSRQHANDVPPPTDRSHQGLSSTSSTPWDDDQRPMAARESQNPGPECGPVR